MSGTEACAAGIGFWVIVRDEVEEAVSWRASPERDEGEEGIEYNHQILLWRFRSNIYNFDSKCETQFSIYSPIKSKIAVCSTHNIRWKSIRRMELVSMKFSGHLNLGWEPLIRGLDYRTSVAKPHPLMFTRCIYDSLLPSIWCTTWIHDADANWKAVQTQRCWFHKFDFQVPFRSQFRLFIKSKFRRHRLTQTWPFWAFMWHFSALVIKVYWPGFTIWVTNTLR